MAAIDWSDAEDTKKQLTKVLGSKAKLPDDTALKHAEQQIKKAFEAYARAAVEMRKAIPAYRVALEGAIAAFKKYDAQATKDDFGLNPKDPKDKKSIDDARKIISRNAHECDGFASIALNSAKKIEQLGIKQV